MAMDLTPAERMKLLAFVCTFAWTDLQVQQVERDLVMRIAGRFGLDEAELAQVQQWLDEPPFDEADPMTIPRRHRELFLEAAELMITADGVVTENEAEHLAMFRDLLR